jgi:hypothetical protein
VAAEIDPDYLDAVYSVGISLVAQGRNDEAAEWFTRSRELLAGDPQREAMARKIDEFFEQYGESAAPKEGAAG